MSCAASPMHCARLIPLACLTLATLSAQSLQPLHDAALRGNRRAAQSWLDKGADPRAPYRANLPTQRHLNGLLPLELAEYTCKPDVIRLLETSTGKPARPDALPSLERPIGSHLEMMVLLTDLLRSTCRLSLDTTGREHSLARRTRDDVAYLYKRWLAQPAPEDWKPTRYSKALNAVLYATESARREPDPALIAEIAEEARVLAQDCSRSREGMGRMVPVSVRTLRGASEESGWQIIYKPRLLAVRPDIEMEPFPTLTSPATWRLPPGRYLVAAQKSGGPRSEVQTLVVGGGLDKIEWQIPLPPEP